MPESIKPKLCIPDIHNIFTWNTTQKVAYLGGEPLNDNEKKGLQEEVKYLENTRLWKVMTDTLAELARQTMFEKSQIFEDMRTGKSILLAIDIQKKIMANIREAK